MTSQPLPLALLAKASLELHRNENRMPPENPIEFAQANRPPDCDTQPAVWRIVDANINRASEGLRVVEDYLRLALEDRHLASCCKQLRHDLGDLAGSLPPARLRCRHTPGDVGTEIETPQEGLRRNPREISAAALERTKQALRVLEEYGKLFDSAWAAKCEQLRYRLYTLEKGVHSTLDAVARLADAHLYVLVDGADSVADFAARVKKVVAGGADIIQLRDKDLSDRQLLERARVLRQLTEEAERLMIINDRADLAYLSLADGVHVGQDELTVPEVRNVCGAEMLVGVSAHSIAQARQAVLDGADYLGVGPVFSSRTKPFRQFAGCSLLYQVASEIRLPAFAIGGIDAQRVEQVTSAGLQRAAVSHAVWKATDPESAARRLRQLIMRGESLPSLAEK